MKKGIVVESIKTIDEVCNEFKKMTKIELVEVVEGLEEALMVLEGRIAVRAKVVKIGRKEEVLKALKEGGRMSVAEIAAVVGISARNVSSQLSYLRHQDGLDIGTDSKGRKVLNMEGV